MLEGGLKSNISGIIIEVSPGFSFISTDFKEFKRQDDGSSIFDGLDIWIDSNELKVSALIRDKSGGIITKLEANEWQVNPNKIFDRNFDDKGVEVINNEGDVILQVDVKGYEKLPDGSEAVVVKFKGVFTHADGWRFILGGYENTTIFMQTIAPSLSEQRVLFDKIFKYPSELHPGERL